MKGSFRALDYGERKTIRPGAKSQYDEILSRAEEASGLPDPSSGASFPNRACAKAAEANRLAFLIFDSNLNSIYSKFYSSNGVYGLPPSIILAGRKNKALEGGINTFYFEWGQNLWCERPCRPSINIFRKFMNVCTYKYKYIWYPPCELVTV